MRNVVLVTKIENKALRRTCFVELDKIVAIEIPSNETFRLYFENAIWNVPSEEHERIMHCWAPYYKDTMEYKKYIRNNK